MMAFTDLAVRTRLSLSFISIVALIAIAYTLAITSFQKLRSTLDIIVSRHLPTTIAAYELAQQSEAIVANTLNLVFSSTQGQRQTAYDRIRDQFAYSSERIMRLQGMDAQHTVPLARITLEYAQLSTTFEELNITVECYIRYRQRRAALLYELLDLRRDLRQGGIDALPASPTPVPIQTIDHAFNLVLDFLATGAAAGRRHAIEEARADYERALAAVATRYLPSLAPAINRLEIISNGDNNLFVARGDELDANDKIDGLLLGYSQILGRLVAAVNELIIHNRAAITQASEDSHVLVDVQIILFTVLSGLCVLEAVLIAMHISRSIIQRLFHLHQAIVCAARGENMRIDSRGSDEISCMAQAVEGFITARWQTEDTLRAAKDAADDANMAKTKLLAVASHDLRQPIQAPLELFVTALLELRLAAEAYAIAEKIALSVTSLRELLDALLDISKLDAGVIAPGRAAVPLASLINRLATEFEPVAKARNLRFRVGPCQGHVISDPVLLERILRNLLANAMRYTISGGVLIGGGGRMRIEIWDSGPGIPADQQQEIFREFHQLHRSGASVGAGLGLAIVDRTARLLGHQIFVESRLGRGSMFAVEAETTAALEVMIPREGSGMFGVTAFCQKLPTEGAGPPVSSVLSGRVIVVIDDDSGIRDSLHLLLKGWGCIVVAAESSDAAVVELSRREVIPEVIIADYRLGDETGDQAIATLCEAVEARLPAPLLITR